MASDMVNAVVAAEEKATQAELEARKQADKIIADAQAEAKQIVADYSKQTKSKAKRAQEFNAASANEIVVKSVKSAVEDGKAIKKNAELKKDLITAAVMEMIIPEI